MRVGWRQPSLAQEGQCVFLAHPEAVKQVFTGASHDRQQHHVALAGVEEA